MSRNLNHGFEDKCSEETFNEIYDMAFARDKNQGIDQGKQELANEIMKFVNSSNRGNADYFIVDKIKELCMEQSKEE